MRKKKNYLSFDDMRVGYDPRTDLITVTSGDSSLKPHGFKITLRRNTPEAEMLRELLSKNDLIPRSRMPEKADYSEKKHGLHGNRIPVGFDDDSEIIWWEPSQDSNALLFGNAGSGKTVYVNFVEDYLQKTNEWDIYRVDGLLDPQQTIESTVNLVYAKLEHYYQKLVADSKFEVRKTLLILDHISLENFNDETKFKIHQIVSKGRAAGVHLIFVTQRVDMHSLSSELQSNFGLKIGFGRINPIASAMVFNSSWPSKRFYEKFTAFVLKNVNLNKRIIKRIKFFHKQHGENKNPCKAD